MLAATMHNRTWQDCEEAYCASLWRSLPFEGLKESELCGGFAAWSAAVLPQPIVNICSKDRAPDIRGRSCGMCFAENRFERHYRPLLVE